MSEFKKNFKTSPDLVALVTKEEHLAMAEKIKPHVPHCASMYNSLMQQAGGHTGHDTFFILHGTPLCTVICEKKISPITDNLAFFCLEEEVPQLIEILGSTSIIRWRDAHIVIHHIPPYLLAPLHLLGLQNEAKIRQAPAMVFTYYPDVDSEKLKVGPGLRVCRLGKAGISNLLKRAKFDNDISLELMYTVAKRVPYVGVYRDAAMTQENTVDVDNLLIAGDEEVPVAWVCSNPTGDVAKLITEEGFRRRGLGTIICTTVARQQATLLGFIPHAIVEGNNFASRAMFSKKAGWYLTHDAFWLEIMQPKEK